MCALDFKMTQICRLQNASKLFIGWINNMTVKINANVLE